MSASGSLATTAWRTALSHSRLLHQDIVVDYASALAHKALAGAAGKGGRMLPEDLLYLLRKVPLGRRLVCRWRQACRIWPYSLHE